MAVRTISAAGGNFNSTATWDEGVVPTLSDDVICRGDGTSGNLTFNGGNCKSLNFTNYSHTLNVTDYSYVYGDITLSPTMTIVVDNNRDLRTAATCIFTSNGKTFSGNLTFNSNVTLVGDLVTTGSYSNISGQLNGYSLYISGNATLSCYGTTNIILNGTGNLILSSCGSNIIINTSGTVTLTPTSHVYTGATFTYTAGTFITTGTTFTTNQSHAYTVVMNTNGLLWNIISSNNGCTIQLDSPLQAFTIMTGNTTIIWTGTYGFTCTNLIIATTGTWTLAAGVTYTCTNFSNTGSSSASRAVLASSSATVKAILNVLNGGTLALGYLNATRIDSSAGRTVWDFAGTITDCLNWNSFTQMPTVARGFIN